MVFLEADAVSIINALTDFAVNKAAPGFAHIGRGIGAIMLLLVLFYYLTSILDGGKFQLKMLLPLLIFLIVCNFGWVAKPVTAFTTTLTESLVEACDNTRISILEDNGCSESANINDMNNERMNKGIQDDKAMIDSMNQGEESSDENQYIQPENPGWIGRGVKRGVDSELNQVNYNTQVECGGEQYAAPGDPDPNKKKLSKKNMSGQGIVSSIVSWICDIVSYVLRALGGIMTGLIVAFGPITFAFAIMPGQAGTIKSWFIRLCQFALYAPICALIECFSVKIFDLLSAATTGGSFMMCIAVAVCNFVCLTSVPTIAQMIIEGAQGAVSLSQGLQSISSAMAAGGMVAAGASDAVFGKNLRNSISNTAGGMRLAGGAGMAADIKQNGFSGFFSRMQQNYMNYLDSMSGRSSK